MKTKTLLIGAAVFAAGYVNALALGQRFVDGYNFCSPPLLGANMSAEAMLATSLQQGDSVLIWNDDGYDTYVFFGPGDWLLPDGTTGSGPMLEMGTGFVYANGSGGPEDNTYTGTEFPGGSKVLKHSVYTLIGSFRPIAGDAESPAYNLPLQSGDAILKWTGSGFGTYVFVAPGLWVLPDSSIGSAPHIEVGEGFFYANGQSVDETWNQP